MPKNERTVGSKKGGEMAKQLSAMIGLIAFAIATPAFAHDQAEAEKAVATVVATYVEKYNN